MARDLSQDFLDQLAAQVIRPAFLVEIETAGGTVRVWTGTGALEWPVTSPATEWIGVGEFGSISALPETTEVRAESVRLGLSGIPASMISLALEDTRPGKPVRIYLLLFTDSRQIIGDPYQCFAGKTDAVRLSEGGDTATIEVSVESRLLDLQRARARRYTHEDQQQEFSGDLGFEYVEQLQEMNLSWGQTPPIPQGLTRRSA